MSGNSGGKTMLGAHFLFARLRCIAVDAKRGLGMQSDGDDDDDDDE